MINTDEKNRVIADFVGAHKNEDGTYEFPEFGSIQYTGEFKTSFKIHQMKYPTSFDWLMPAIRKCRKISKESENGLFDKPTDNLAAQLWYEGIEECLLELNISTTFCSVYEMIEWYTKTKKDG